MATKAAEPLSSSGSYCAVYDRDADSYLTLDNSACEYEVQLPVDTFAIASGNGYEQGMHRQYMVRGVRLSMPEDDPSSIETSGLVKGKCYNLWIRRGDSDSEARRFDKFTAVVFSGLRKAIRSADGTQRLVEITFEGGSYLPSTEASAELDTYLVSIGRESA